MLCVLDIFYVIYIIFYIYIYFIYIILYYIYIVSIFYIYIYKDPDFSEGTFAGPGWFPTDTR